MKRTRIIAGAVAAVVAIALCAFVCAAWKAQGCGAWSLVAAVAMYTSIITALWGTVDAKIKENNQ